MDLLETEFVCRAKITLLEITVNCARLRITMVPTVSMSALIFVWKEVTVLMVLLGRDCALIVLEIMVATNAMDAQLGSMARLAKMCALNLVSCLVTAMVELTELAV